MRLTLSYMRHLIEGTLPRVAIFIDSSSQWGREILFGVNDYAREHGPWNLHIEPCMGDHEVRIPNRWTGDGIIARIHSESFARSLNSINLPIVNVSSIQLKKDPFPRVTNDLHAAARLAFEHFTDRGFTHFGYFSLLARPYVCLHRASLRTRFKKRTIPSPIFPEILPPLASPNGKRSTKNSRSGCKTFPNRSESSPGMRRVFGKY